MAPLKIGFSRSVPAVHRTCLWGRISEYPNPLQIRHSHATRTLYKQDHRFLNLVQFRCLDSVCLSLNKIISYWGCTDVLWQTFQIIVFSFRSAHRARRYGTRETLVKSDFLHQILTSEFTMQCDTERQSWEPLHRFHEFMEFSKQLLKSRHQSMRCRNWRFPSVKRSWHQKFDESSPK